MHQAFGHLFFGHAYDVGLHMAGHLWFSTAHGCKGCHVEHPAVSELESFALVSSTEDGTDHAQSEIPGANSSGYRFHTAALSGGQLSDLSAGPQLPGIEQVRRLMETVLHRNAFR